MIGRALRMRDPEPRFPLAIGALAGAAVAAGARLAWPHLPAGPLVLLFCVAATCAAAIAVARTRRAPARAGPSGNLLARQLAVTAREAEARRFQRFARDAPVGVVFLGRDGTIRYANEEYLRLVGRSREELEAEQFRPPDPDAPTGWLSPELGARHETECVRKDGTRIPVLVGLSAQEDGLAAFVIDLSAEKAARRAREESEARHRALAEKLAELDRRKDEFLGMLSHELRNPLAPIRNSVYLLRRGVADAAVRDRVLAVVERQVTHLTRLVDDLLDVTRITRGKVELRRQRVDLAALLRRTVEDHRILAGDLGIELVVEVPGAAVVVDGDPTRLMQIVGNLLQNAVKFSSRGGKVWLGLALRGGVAEIRVRDEGAGIDHDLLERLFEPFVQAERTLARSSGGLGLGLALVKGLTQMHGGWVSASSAGPGRGAELTVRLPLAAEEHAGDHLRAPALPSRPTRVARVLVVEDNPDVASSLRDLVEAFGHDVDVASNGDAALARARARPPDVVLCDIGLPGMSGYEIARAFRRDPALRHARLVAVSGYAQAEDRREAAAAGFDRHVAKPPDPGELQQLIG